MGRKSKYSKELKIDICKRYLNSDASACSFANEMSTTNVVVGRWIKNMKLMVNQPLTN